MESGSLMAEIIFQEKFSDVDGLSIYNFSKHPQKLVYIVEIAVFKTLLLCTI